MSDRPKIKQEIVERLRDGALFDREYANSDEEAETATALLAMLDWYEAGK